jgi:hypothetical protein
MWERNKVTPHMFTVEHALLFRHLIFTSPTRRASASAFAAKPRDCSRPHLSPLAVEHPHHVSPVVSFYRSSLSYRILCVVMFYSHEGKHHHLQPLGIIFTDTHTVLTSRNYGVATVW